LAVAYSGRELGVPVTVVVPETTAEATKKKIRDYGATVIAHGQAWDDANELGNLVWLL
jgi:L-serine/L-threonine ammonia-lyase